jgi:hypothetical protein
LQRFERTVSVLGRSKSTFNNYSRHVAAISLYFGKIPTELDPEQVHDYLFYLQKKSKSPSQSYFKRIRPTNPTTPINSDRYTGEEDCEAQKYTLFHNLLYRLLPSDAIPASRNPQVSYGRPKSILSGHHGQKLYA